MVRAARHRIERACIEDERGSRRVEVRGAVELHRPPARVPERLERLAREQARHLVLAVAVARRPRENRDHHLGPEAADDVQHVLEQGIARPEAPCLVGGLRVAEIVGPREELPRAVELAGGEQLLRADDPELGPELRTDQVLAAFAPVEREVGDLGTHAPGEEREQVRGLVIGVGADHQHAFVRAELLQGGR